MIRLMVSLVLATVLLFGDGEPRTEAKVTALNAEQRLRIENSNLARRVKDLEAELAEVKWRLADMTQKQQDQKLMNDICESAGLKPGPETCVVEREDLGDGKQGDWRVRAPKVELKDAK